jgi:hypothetical protein
MMTFEPTSILEKQKNSYVAHDKIIASLKDYEMHKMLRGKNSPF